MKKYTFNLHITGTVTEDEVAGVQVEIGQTKLFNEDTKVKVEHSPFESYVQHLQEEGKEKPAFLKPACAFADCEAPVFAKGKCKRHYNQMYKAKQKMKGRNI